VRVCETQGKYPPRCLYQCNSERKKDRLTCPAVGFKNDNGLGLGIGIGVVHILELLLGTGIHTRMWESYRVSGHKQIPHHRPAESERIWPFVSGIWVFSFFRGGFGGALWSRHSFQAIEENVSTIALNGNPCAIDSHLIEGPPPFVFYFHLLPSVSLRMSYKLWNAFSVRVSGFHCQKGGLCEGAPRGGSCMPMNGAKEGNEQFSLHFDTNIPKRPGKWRGLINGNEVGFVYILLFNQN